MRRVFATLTSKGQFTLPREIREAWGLKPGDRLGFEVLGPVEGRIVPAPRRSILDGIEALTVHDGPPLTQADIDASIDEDIADRLAQTAAGRP